MHLQFGIYDVEKHIPKRCSSIVIGRAQSLRLFLDRITKHYALEAIVIERQFNNNTKAMELMGVFVGIAQFYSNVIKIFDPKLKFTKIHETYVVESKLHKKQSIKYAERVLYKYWNDLLNPFYECDKRDDYSDAINQGLVYGIDEGIFRGLSLIEYRDICINNDNDDELRFGDNSTKTRKKRSV
jgi:hypothetical protein